MDSIIDKLLDKVSKKQIICVVTLICLLQPEAPKEYLASVGALGMIVQGILDYLKPKGENSETNNINPA